VTNRACNYALAPVLQAHRQGEKAATISRKPNVGVGITDRPDGLVKGAGSTRD